MYLQTWVQVPALSVTSQVIKVSYLSAPDLSPCLYNKRQQSFPHTIDVRIKWERKCHELSTENARCTSPMYVNGFINDQVLDRGIISPSFRLDGSPEKSGTRGQRKESWLRNHGKLTTCTGVRKNSHLLRSCIQISTWILFLKWLSTASPIAWLEMCGYLYTSPADKLVQSHLLNCCDLEVPGRQGEGQWQQPWEITGFMHSKTWPRFHLCKLLASWHTSHLHS